MADNGMLSLEITGLNELEEALRKYGYEILISSELQNAVVAGGIEVANEAISILNDNIYNGKEPGNWRRSGLLRARTKADEKARIEGNDIITSTRSRTKYAKYIEKGTGIFATGGDGRKTPWVYRTNTGGFYTTHGAKARPFLRPALERNKNKIIQLNSEGLQKFLKNKASKI